MRSPCPLAPSLVLFLLVGASSARAQPRACEAELRRIVLEAGQASPVEVCISPGLSTTWLFDAPLAADGVLLEGRDRFQWMEAAGRLLVLVPSERLEPGARLRLEVRFAPGEALAGASFVLVAHRDQAERQVEVARRRPPPAPLQAELQRKELELQQCRDRQGPAALEASAPVSLGRLLVARVFPLENLQRRNLAVERLMQPPGEVQVERGALFRLKSRLVARLHLESTGGTSPWALEGAELLGASGDVHRALWFQQETALLPGGFATVWVEWELPSKSLLEPHTLRLWDMGKARTVTLRELTLP
jgi:uncharacterized protein (TIGR02268 family)